MNLNQLNYIIEISKCGSINKAAQNLYMAQPSLSAAVKQLEEELDFAVFQRKNSGIELTDEGKLLVNSAKLILDEVSRIRAIPTIFDSQKNISVSGTWSSLLMNTFMQFRNSYRSYPAENIQDNFKETSFHRAVQDVRDQDSRLAIVSCFESHADLYRLELQRYFISMEPMMVGIPAVVAMAEDHYLAGCPVICPRQLSSCALVTYDIFSGNEWLAAFDIPVDANIINVFDRCGMMDAIRNRHVAVVMQDPDFESALTGCVIRPLKSDQSLGIYLLQHKAYSLNPRESQFISSLQSRLNAVYKG